jgi:hypothetical protein
MRARERCSLSVEEDPADGVGARKQLSAAQDAFGICVPATCSASVSEEIALTPGSYVLSAEATGSSQGQCVDLGGGISCYMPRTTASFDVALGGGPTVPALSHPGRGLVVVALAIAATACITPLGSPFRAPREDSRRDPGSKARS